MKEGMTQPRFMERERPFPKNRVVRAAAAGLLMAFACCLYQPGSSQAQENGPPVIATPASTSLQYLFPNGNAAVLDFTGAPVSDPNGDPTTVRFVLSVPDTSTTGDFTDTKDATPSEALFAVSRNGDDFEFTAGDGTSPADFVALYGTGANYQVPGRMYANDGTADSEPMEFTIRVSYDASPQFHTPAKFQRNQRWALADEVEVYEGPGVNSELGKLLLGDYDGEGNRRGEQPPRLAETEGLQIPWTARTAGEVRWHLGNTKGAGENPRVQCLDQGQTSNLSWPDEGSEDSGDFTITPGSSTSASSHSLVKFKDAPDYENTNERLYKLRLFNRHDLHLIGEDGATPGCSGSALDLSIRVKDVGPPAPPKNVRAVIQQDGKIWLRWDTPHANVFLENGEEVDFPHEHFNVENLLMTHSPEGLAWSGKPFPKIVRFKAATSGIQHIQGTPGTAYTFTLWLTNPEGGSERVSVTATPPLRPGKAGQPTASEAGPTSLRVEWEAPEDNGAEITGYTVRHRKKGAYRWEEQDLGTPTMTTITGLDVRTVYEVQVRGNSDGGDGTANGPWSETGEGSTGKNIVSISGDNSAPVRSGDDATATISLVQAEDLPVRLSYAWTNNFGTDRNEETEASNRATWSVGVPVDQGDTATAATGKLTVQVLSSSDYTVGDDDSVTFDLEVGPRAPVIKGPVSDSLSYLFPRGTKAKLDFNGDPATDLN